MQSGPRLSWSNGQTHQAINAPHTKPRSMSNHNHHNHFLCFQPWKICQSAECYPMGHNDLTLDTRKRPQKNTTPFTTWRDPQKINLPQNIGKSLQTLNDIECYTLLGTQSCPNTSFQLCRCTFSGWEWFCSSFVAVGNNCKLGHLLVVRWKHTTSQPSPKEPETGPEPSLKPWNAGKCKLPCHEPLRLVSFPFFSIASNLHIIHLPCFFSFHSARVFWIILFPLLFSHYQSFSKMVFLFLFLPLATPSNPGIGWFNTTRESVSPGAKYLRISPNIRYMFELNIYYGGGGALSIRRKGSSR